MVSFRRSLDCISLAVLACRNRCVVGSEVRITTTSAFSRKYIRRMMGYTECLFGRCTGGAVYFIVMQTLFDNVGRTAPSSDTPTEPDSDTSSHILMANGKRIDVHHSMTPVAPCCPAAPNDNQCHPFAMPLLCGPSSSYSSNKFVGYGLSLALASRYVLILMLAKSCSTIVK